MSEENGDGLSLWAAYEPRLSKKASHPSSSPLLWLTFDRTDTTTVVDRAAVWATSVLTALAVFKEQASSVFLCRGGSVSTVSFTFLVLFRLSPTHPASLWFLRQGQRAHWIWAARHVHRPERACCCGLYLWNTEKQAGPVLPWHEKYITSEVQRVSRSKTNTSFRLKNRWLFVLIIVLLHHLDPCEVGISQVSYMANDQVHVNIHSPKTASGITNVAAASRRDIYCKQQCSEIIPYTYSTYVGPCSSLWSVRPVSLGGARGFQGRGKMRTFFEEQLEH